MKRIDMNFVIVVAALGFGPLMGVAQSSPSDMGKPILVAGPLGAKLTVDAQGILGASQHSGAHSVMLTEPQPLPTLTPIRQAQARFVIMKQWLEKDGDHYQYKSKEICRSTIRFPVFDARNHEAYYAPIDQGLQCTVSNGTNSTKIVMKAGILLVSDRRPKALFSERKHFFTYASFEGPDQAGQPRFHQQVNGSSVNDLSLLSVETGMMLNDWMLFQPTPGEENALFSGQVEYLDNAL